MHRGIGDWEELKRNFNITFSFENNNPLIDSALQVIKNNIFSSKDLLGSMPLHSAPRATVTIEEIFHCYNFAEESQDEEYPSNL